jgi:hypothetical protein
VRSLVGRSDDTPPASFANVITRATFSSEVELRACLAWVAPGGRLIAYRAGDATSDADRVISYQLRDDTHTLHVWTK